MQNTSHLHRRSILTALAIHIGNPETTLVHGEVPVAPTLDPWGAYRIPDLIVVYDCDIALVDEQGGYAIDRQGKAPDFVLEVASRSTGDVDYTDKRRDYERFGIGEYWRFDPIGCLHPWLLRRYEHMRQPKHECPLSPQAICRYRT